MTHFLKTWPEYFEAVLDGRKTFEIRKNDRGFSVGDTLVLQEFNPSSGTFTQRECDRIVTYMTDFEQKPGYVVMAMTLDAAKEKQP